jgi:deoxyribonuclease-4
MLFAFTRGVPVAIKIGPAGSGGLGYIKALQKAARMGLDCLEVAFTYGVRMTLAEAEAVGAVAIEEGIILSVHAPYYINLAADDQEKLAASKERILAACRMAAAMGAENVVFHPGFYQGKSGGETFTRVAKSVDELQRHLRRQGWNVMLSPETTGKPSQFGSLDEIIKLAAETGCGFTVDFSHLLARAAGSLDYGEVMDRLPHHFHAHFSGIDYGPKGERKHLNTTPRFFRPLADALVSRRLDVTLISESPRPYQDAAMMKRIIGKLLAG